MNGFASPLLTKTAKNTGRGFRQALTQDVYCGKQKWEPVGFDWKDSPKSYGKDIFNVVIRRTYAEE